MPIRPPATGASAAGAGADYFHGGDKPVSPASHCLDKSRLFGVILEHLTDFADGCIDAVVGVEEDIFAPNLFDNLVPADELSVLRDQQQKKLHGDMLQLQWLARPAQFIGAEIELKLAPKSNGICRDRPTRCHAAHPQTKRATFYIEFQSLFSFLIFCELRSFITIKTFFTPPLLDKKRVWGMLHKCLSRFRESERGTKAGAGEQSRGFKVFRRQEQ